VDHFKNICSSKHILFICSYIDGIHIIVSFSLREKFRIFWRYILFLFSYFIIYELPLIISTAFIFWQHVSTLSYFISVLLLTINIHDDISDLSRSTIYNIYKLSGCYWNEEWQYGCLNVINNKNVDIKVKYRLWIWDNVNVLNGILKFT
jgi:hypothetical protein